MSGAMAAEPRKLRHYRGDVDETLFGTRTKGSATTSSSFANTAPSRYNSTSSSSKPDPTSKDSVMISLQELRHIHGSSVILTQNDIEKMKHQSDSQRSQMAAAAQERKEKMMKMERESAKRKPLTESEQIEATKRDMLLSHAKQAMDEELDDVKHMNQMTLYAKCVTIRDAQILEKQKAQGTVPRCVLLARGIPRTSMRLVR